MSLEKDFLKAIQTASTPKTSAYDTAAKVVRVDGSRVWVHIDGGASETPVERTIDCAVGDTVRIRLSGGEAYIIGNNTAPPTDDAVANIARTTALNADENAKRAKMTAEDAQDLAGVAASAAASAQQSADAAQQSATAAGNAASQAQTKANQAANAASAAQNSADAAQTAANNAQTSADNASEYASRALGNLSTVQSVAETLAWITAHGTMTLTSDTALDPTHVYFVRDNDGDYTVGSYKYSVVTEPKASELNTYYELSIDESLNNYVATHLALTSEGLWIIPVAGGFKVLIATGAGSTYTTAGTYIVDGNGDAVGQFTTGAITLGSRASGSTVGLGSQVFGKNCVASQSYANAQGYETEASGFYSTALGLRTTASGNLAAYAEGRDTVASGSHAHAQGYGSVASGGSSFAGGFHTIAGYNDQTTLGKYNDNKSDTLFEIGNGTADNARSNAFEVYDTGRFGTPGLWFSINASGEPCVTFEDGN